MAQGQEPARRTGDEAGDPMREALRSRRDRDLAVLLPLYGTLMFLPPIVLLFASPVTLLGIPLIVLYIFSVWALLIVLCLRLTRRLWRADGGTRP